MLVLSRLSPSRSLEAVLGQIVWFPKGERDSTFPYRRPPGRVVRGETSGNLEQPLENSAYLRSWELSNKYMDSVWMALWCLLCQQRLDSESTRPLEIIVATHPHLYIGYLYRAVTAWQQGLFDVALIELESAIQLEPDREDAYFWKGMACDSLGHDADAIAAIEMALARELPPVLLAPLHWFAKEGPSFYAKFIAPLLARYTKPR